MVDRVEVLGLDEVLRKIKGLETELRRKVLIKGARAGANVFKRGIFAQKVPEQTGSLKRAISTRAMKKSIPDIVGAMVVIKASLTKKQKQSIKNARDPWYWFLQEYGWFAGGRHKVKSNKGLSREGFRAKNKRTRKKVPGKFFVKKAFEANKDKVKNSYMTAILKGVETYGK